MPFLPGDFADVAPSELYMLDRVSKVTLPIGFCRFPRVQHDTVTGVTRADVIVYPTTMSATDVETFHTREASERSGAIAYIEAVPDSNDDDRSRRGYRVYVSAPRVGSYLQAAGSPVLYLTPEAALTAATDAIMGEVTRQARGW